jgi:hypothetical protein
MILGKFKLSLSQVIRTCFIIFVILVAESSSNIIETKFENDATNRTINLSTIALKLEEDIKNDLYSAKDTYTGDLTGYGADCPLCGGTLACLPNYYVKDGTDTYADPIYGNVRIVASSKNLPCGTIVRFQHKGLSKEPIVAIVLDRGVLGNDLDLLSPSEAYAKQYVGRKSITYDVLRQGWNS